MIISTTGRIDGYRIEKVLGIVTGHVVFGVNAFKDLKGRFTDFFGGRSTTYEKVLDNGESQAAGIMVQKANEVGANAILGVNFDYEVMTFDGQMMMIMCTGTAMKVSRSGEPPASDLENGDGAGGTHVAGKSGSGGSRDVEERAERDPEQSSRYERDVDAEIRSLSGG